MHGTGARHGNLMSRVAAPLAETGTVGAGHLLGVEVVGARARRQGPAPAHAGNLCLAPCPGGHGPATAAFCTVPGLLRAPGSAPPALLLPQSSPAVRWHAGKMLTDTAVHPPKPLLGWAMRVHDLCPPAPARWPPQALRGRPHADLPHPAAAAKCRDAHRRWRRRPADP